jgi:threonine dehydrogenase-like Zn-dependent dehydrogenase
VLGVSCEDYRQNGAFAEFVTLPARVLYKVPTDLKLEYAALIEPFSIALHAISRVQIDKVQTAFVAGAGMIGLATVQMLQAKGVKTIFCADVIDERLAVAKQCGATIINSRAADPAKVITEQTEGVGADCVFEAVGLSQTVEMAIRSVRKGGSVVLVGNVSPRTDFPLQSVVTREVSLFGSCASRGEYPECLDMMSQGVLSPDLLISAIAPLSEGAAWFERLYKKDPNLIKVLLKP